MNHQHQAIRQAPARGAGRALFVSFFALLPVGFVSGLMLMQILGVWAY